MESTPIYISSIHIKNIRTFKSEIKLNFMREDGSLPQWTLLLGDNGIGKSTLLQSVAWMKPYLPDGTDKGMKIPMDKIEPTINNEDNETLERLVSNAIDTDQEFGSFRGDFISGRHLNTKTKKKRKNEYSCYTTMEIKVDRDYKLKDVKHKFHTDDEDENVFNKNEIFVFGYSASRSLGKANVTEQSVSDSILGFLADQTILYDAEEILHTINYAALGATKGEKARYNNYLSRVKEALVGILPDIENVKDIEITAPKFVGSSIKQAELLINTKHGKKIPFYDFSLGYRTVISWVVDLSWRMFNSYPNSDSPIHETAIVLIDEIDLHLHPKWQREIIRNLSVHFPNVQFIATAHSPLMVQAAIDQNYAVLRFFEDEVIVVNDPKSIDGWRVDQILTSEFFGLTTARGLEYEELLNRRQELIRKNRILKKDKLELRKIHEKLSKYSVGETEDEIENRRIISRVVDEIKNQKVAIEL